GEMHNIQTRKSPLAAPIGEGDWDHYYSFLFTLRKNSKIQLKMLPNQQNISSYNYDSDAQIYCVYHQPFPVAHLGRIKPIFAGAAANSAKSGALTDITRGESRLPNERWSELSAYYRIWREGPRSEVV